VLRWRPWLLWLAAVSVVRMVLALARGLGLATLTIQQVYPRANERQLRLWFAALVALLLITLLIAAAGLAIETLLV
jgi:hypothetical protein